MRVLCFGDSNTYGYDPRSFLGGQYPAHSRWVDVLANLTGWTVVNGGENGREIPVQQGEWDRFAYLLSKFNPDLLLIMLGGNDLLQGANADQTSKRMAAFLKKVPLLPEQIVLITPPPLNQGAWVTEERLLIESTRLAARYAEICQDLGVTWLNAGEWGITLTFDGVHFDEAGHQLFAEKLHGALAELVS